jgi:hypothetical protein
MGDGVRPDPTRLGGLAWTRRTGGRLTRRERTRLLGEIAKGQAVNLAGRVRLAAGRLPAGAAEIDARSFAPPDSALAREAERACAELPETIAGHSYRTWMFGLALAALDGSDPDPELFYCASLLHDMGLAEAVPGRDFTLGGAERAISCAESAGAEAGRGEAIADAICAHATPGARLDRDGAPGCYVQWGAMVDVGGLRLWDISPANREETLHRHPRQTAFKRELTEAVRAEARAVPGGRFALLTRCGFPLAIRLAPFKP